MLTNYPFDYPSKTFSYLLHTKIATSPKNYHKIWRQDQSSQFFTSTPLAKYDSLITSVADSSMISSYNWNYYIQHYLTEMNRESLVQAKLQDLSMHHYAIGQA